MPDGESLSALQELGAEYDWLQPAIEELESMPLDRWQGEHTRLFITGFPTTPCPPFESAYRHGSMGGSSLEDLQGMYHRSGLLPQDMPADYLGTELEYAAHLLEDGGEPAKNLLREFREQHLILWVPRFANELVEHSTLELYSAVGRVLFDLFSPYSDEHRPTHRI